MFTGIVVEQGKILKADATSSGAVLKIASGCLAGRLGSGDSVSIDGCCLTVVETDGDSFQVEATPETLRLTNLGGKGVGQSVNLEPAARINDFLGGHLVQGHVDGVGRLLSLREEGNSWIYRFSAPEDILRYCTLKGSITVNGVSLTISGLNGEWFEVTVIPHTYKVTNFSSLRLKDEVNLEADVISKYVESHVRRFLGTAVLVFFMLLSPLGAADLSLGSNSILIYENTTQRETRRFIVRIGRFRPDLVFEWESITDQGTVQIYREALSRADSFTLTRLFETGVDQESPAETTLLLSDELYNRLKTDKTVKMTLNRTPVKLKRTGSETRTIRINGQESVLPVLRVEDSRRGVWFFLDSAEVPLVVEFESPYFRQRLASITLASETGLRWLRRLPPVR